MRIVDRFDDGSAWNDLMLSLPYPDMHQAYEWGELKREQGWRPYRLAVLDGEICVAALSMLVRRVHGFGSILYAPRGPVLRGDDSTTWERLDSSIRELAHTTHAIFLRLSPGLTPNAATLHENVLRHGFIHLADDWTTWNMPRIVMRLSTEPSEAELKKNLHKSTKLYVSRAVKRGAVLENDTSIDGTSRLHRLLLQTGQRKGIPVRGQEYFRELRRLYLTNGNGCLLIVSNNGVDLAALLAVRFARTAYLLYSAINSDSEDGRQLRPGAGLHWAMIRWAKENGCTMIDWGGSGTNFPPRETDAGFGVYQFKQSFGCSLEKFPGYYDCVFKPALYQGFRLGEKYLLPLAWGVRAKVGKWSERNP